MRSKDGVTPSNGGLPVERAGRRLLPGEGETFSGRRCHELESKQRSNLKKS